MNNAQADAHRLCGYLRPDRTCAIMEALATESSSLCKYWREQPEQCRYLEKHLMKRR
jgi:hypothetical protein